MGGLIMLGAIIGDMVGSIYEFSKPNSKEFNISNVNTKMTDDSLLTIATAKVLLANYPIRHEKESLGLLFLSYSRIIASLKSLNRRRGFKKEQRGYQRCYYHRNKERDFGCVK